MSTLQAASSLSWVVAQASSLLERLHHPAFICQSNEDNPKTLERLANWCQVVAKGEQDKFLQRLGADGLDIDTVHHCLGDVLYDSQFPLPGWAETLQTVMQTANQWGISREPQYLNWQLSPGSNPVPFEPFYGPCLQVAHSKLARVISASQFQYLSEPGQMALSAGLLKRLQAICGWTLFQEFSQFRSSGDTVRDFLLHLGCKSQQKYHAFLQKLFQDGFCHLFETYPVLGRLVSTAIDLWVEATAEFIQRLETDWSALKQEFRHEHLNQVIDLKTNLSDPHNRGRSTTILEFNTGLKLVYKPKDLGTDVAYFQFLDWCNKEGLPLPFKCLQVLNRGTYGWVEFVETLPCTNEADAQRFYQRCGMLLCLIHILEGTDCHFENLIAHGEQPVLIDTEALLTPRPVEGDSSLFSKVIHTTHQILDESVLRTLLLPQKGFSPNDLTDLDISGFGTVEKQQQPVMQLKDVNLDSMQIEFTTSVIPPNVNAATLKGVPLSPENYLKEFVHGFEQMYDFLLHHQSELLKPDSPLFAFSEQAIRFLFRGTNIYSIILQQSYNPQFLKTGVERSLWLEILSRAFLVGSTIPRCWPIFEAECQALEQMDIPFFTGTSSQDSLVLSTGKTIPHWFADTSLNQVLKRIRCLSDSDKAQQVSIIWGSFEARFLSEPSLETTPAVRSIQEVGWKATETPKQSERFLQQAVHIGELIQQTAIEAPDGSVAWINLFLKLNAEGFRFGRLKQDLFNGNCGIALFLAALARTTGDLRWQELALKVLRSLEHDLNATRPEFATQLLRQHGIGGSLGLAGIVYSLAQIYQLLKVPSLQLLPPKIVALITHELIKTDQTFDVSRGAAGTILGLLALSESSNALNLAIACGEHLLKHQLPTENGFRSWKTWKGKMLTGFFQGNAGIAYALLRLFAVTHDVRFRDAAMDAIAYEQHLFSPAVNNWADLRMDKPVFQASWAQGAPGIGLARLGGLPALDTPAIRQEITAAIDTTQKFAVWGIDSLCWGNFGRLETLLVAADQLNCPEWRVAAEQAALTILNEATARNGFVLLPNGFPNHSLPGLFHGLAGIGYQLLRLVDRRLPSVLLWELSKVD